MIPIRELRSVSNKSGCGIARIPAEFLNFREQLSAVFCISVGILAALCALVAMCYAGAVELGLYDRAYKLLLLPVQQSLTRF
jgi:hypothetical protein